MRDLRYRKTVTPVYLFLANLVLETHVVFVAFVVLGLLLIVAGGYLNWRWIRNSWFRAIHLLGIAIVVAQTWLGIVCPLTILEMWLRREAGAVGYEGSFIRHWLQALLYYDAPASVFVVAHSVFGILVLLAMIKFPPNFLRGNNAIDPEQQDRCNT